MLDEATEYPDGYKPFDAQLTEEELEDVLAEELEDDLRRFGSGFGGLPDRLRPHLLKAAQDMLEAIQRGEEPDMASLLPSRFLDI